MDCEKFDLCVMDALYDELDELTYAALKRHVDGCSRCSGVFTGLRATRSVGVLPIAEPSEGFEERILEAAMAAQKTTPLPRKMLRALAWAGSHAMRPQLAMAALFFLVIGSSLLLLRAKPGSRITAERAAEHGAPAPDEEAMREPAAPSIAGFGTAAPIAAAPGQSLPAAEPMERKATDDEQSRPAKKKEDKDAPGAEAKTLLTEARGTRDRSGCAAAVGKFDEVGARFPATSAAADAMFEEATCYRSMGEAQKARDLFLALKANAAYRDRVEVELASEAPAANNVQQGIASRAPARAKVAMPAAAPPAAAPQAAATPQASGPSPATNARARAAPKPNSAVDLGL